MERFVEYDDWPVNPQRVKPVTLFPGTLSPYSTVSNESYVKLFNASSRRHGIYGDDISDVGIGNVRQPNRCAPFRPKKVTFVDLIDLNPYPAYQPSPAETTYEERPLSECILPKQRTPIEYDVIYDYIDSETTPSPFDRLVFRKKPSYC